jgi:hypothetical protein
MALLLQGLKESAVPDWDRDWGDTELIDSASFVQLTGAA